MFRCGGTDAGGVIMKKLRKILMIGLMLIITAGSAMAGAIGDTYTVMGMNPGWILVIIGLLAIGLGYWDFIAKKKAVTAGIGIIVFGAIFLVPVTATVAPPTTTTDCPGFEISATATTSGGDYITTTTWDETSQTLTVPLTVQDSSDGNLTGDQAGINITIDPIGAGYTTENMATVTVSTDYLFKYGGEYVIDETGGDYSATIETADGTEYYTDTIDIQLTTTAWCYVSYTFVNATSGSWVSELSQIGDSVTWYITLANSCGSQTETITVNAIVVSYTA